MVMPQSEDPDLATHEYTLQGSNFLVQRPPPPHRVPLAPALYCGKFACTHLEE